MRFLGTEQCKVKILDLLIRLQEHEFIVFAAALLIFLILTFLLLGTTFCGFLVHCLCHPKSFEVKGWVVLHLNGGLV